MEKQLIKILVVKYNINIVYNKYVVILYPDRIDFFKMNIEKRPLEVK